MKMNNVSDTRMCGYWEEPTDSDGFMNAYVSVLHLYTP